MVRRCKRIGLHRTCGVFADRLFQKWRNKIPLLSEKAKELLQSSGSFIIAGLMVSIYACTDKLMLKQMLGADAVGHYSLASTVSVSWAFILSAIIDSLYPEIVQSFQKDRLRYERKNRQLYAIVFMYPCLCPQ